MHKARTPSPQPSWTRTTWKDGFLRSGLKAKYGPRLTQYQKVHVVWPTDPRLPSRLAWCKEERADFAVKSTWTDTHTWLSVLLSFLSWPCVSLPLNCCRHCNERCDPFNFLGSSSLQLTNRPFIRNQSGASGCETNGYKTEKPQESLQEQRLGPALMPTVVGTRRQFKNT